MKKLFLVTLISFGFMIAAAMLYKPSRQVDTANLGTKQEITQEIVVITPFSTYKASIVKTDRDKAALEELPGHKNTVR